MVIPWGYPKAQDPLQGSIPVRTWYTSRISFQGLKIVLSEVLTFKVKANSSFVNQDKLEGPLPDELLKIIL